jgi:hypothetical protein
MKIVALAFVLALLLAGCTPAPLNRANYDGLVVCHPDVLDQVERQARRSFAQVYWYNCPKATLRVL